MKLQRTPQFQLISLFVQATLALALLLLGLNWLSANLGSNSNDVRAISAEANSVALVLTQEPPQLDSSRATDAVSGMVLGHVMEGLLRMGQDDRLEAAVAERWEVTPDRVTFWLRPDARWSDGQPITAADFIFAWQTALKPTTGSEYAFLLFSIKHAEAINRGERPASDLGVSAPTPQQLVIELERPVPFFDKIVVFPVFLPIREDFYLATQGRFGADAQDLLYSGPFVITEWIHGASLRLERNPHYWNQQDIHLQRIDFPYITSDKTASLNFFKDERIATTGLITENLNEAMRLGWAINQHQDGTLFYVEFNHRSGSPLANLNLRRAIQYSLDMDELVNRVIKLPGYQSGVSLFPRWLMGVDSPLREEYPPTRITPDPVKAQDYLEQALAELGMDALPELVLLAGDNPSASIQSEWLQEALKKRLGISIRIDKQIFKQRLAKMTSGDFDMVLAGWGPDYNDPLTFGDLFASWNLNNRGRYADDELDGLIAEAQNSVDPATRMRAFGDIQDLVTQKAVILPMYERGITYVVNPRLVDIKRRVIGPDPDLTRARILPEES